MPSERAPAGPGPSAPAPPTPGDPAARRAALVDALAYLLDEVALLRRVLPRVPVPLQTERPRPDLLSLRETFARIAVRDGARTRVLAPDADARAADALAADAETDAEALAALEVDALLDRVTAARQALVEGLAGWTDADWARAVPTADGPVLAEPLVAGFVQEDAALLRALAEQLYDAQKLGG